MSIESHAGHEEKRNAVLETTPRVQIFLRPIAPPAALGLAGFAGSTWIAASYVAMWWGSSESPTIFFPFVATFGGAYLIVCPRLGEQTSDCCWHRSCAVHCGYQRLRSPRHAGDSGQYDVGQFLDGSWNPLRIYSMSPHSLLYYGACADICLPQAAGAIEPHSVHTHFPELASWFVVLTVFTWSCALAASARDVVLTTCLTSLAIGSTIACCLFGYNGGTSDTSGSGDGESGSVTMAIKAASYFWMFSSLCAWWRVTVYLVEEAYGPGHTITRFFPIGRTAMEKRAPLVIPGLGEPGVKRGVPKPI